METPSNREDRIDIGDKKMSTTNPVKEKEFPPTGGPGLQERNTVNDKPG